MKLRRIENLDVRGKYVLLRDDFNVQIVDGKITDAFRIQQSMPTINALCAAGARVAICAHLGRPKGARNMAYTLAPVAEYMNVPLVAMVMLCYWKMYAFTPGKKQMILGLPQNCPMVLIYL